MEENNKAKVPIIRENITAWRVRIKLFNWITIICGRQKNGEELQPTDQYNNKKPGKCYLSIDQIAI